MAILVRELPPLRHHLEAITPNGRVYRWGEDELNPADVPSGLRHSSTMPGGYEALDCVLPRRADLDYGDMERLTTINVWSAGGQKVGEYRLERTPRVSGDQMAISPSAVGWQAHLEDNKSIVIIYIDRDQARWTPPAANRRAALGTTYRLVNSSPGYSVSATLPALIFVIQLNGGAIPISEAWYDAGAARIKQINYTFTTQGWGTTASDANFQAPFVGSTDDAGAAGVLISANLNQTVLSGTGTFTLSTSRRFVRFFGIYNSTLVSAAFMDRPFYLTPVMIGEHGLTVRGTHPAEGFYASDVVAHAVTKYAPKLTAIPGETVISSSFVVPQLSFNEPTTAGEIVRQATRFGLEDWAVWNDRKFWWHPRNAFGRNWRARIAPAQLEETGPQVDRLFESVLVEFKDVDGSTRTAGPAGSGADSESALLKDADPDNPANQLGITRRERLVMGIGSAASATEVGRRFLEEAKLLDRSGRAKIVGHVTDDRGVAHPYSHVRAGDTITFVDAADASPRRIVRADHDRASRTCTVDLDAPPEGMTALLERLGVVLAPLGL